MSRSPNTYARRAARVAGFTLIELLVVLIIIAVIIAIVLPALGSARRAARAATTRGMMTNITNAVGVFMNDNKRTPGYFTARQMADSANLTQGFSAMQNVMLDLAGGIDPNPRATVPPDLDVGPGTTNGTHVLVNPDLMGSTGGNNNKVYFTPDAKHWVAQNAGGQQLGVAANQSLRSVIDDFGGFALADDLNAVSGPEAVMECDGVESPDGARGSERRPRVGHWKTSGDLAWRCDHYIS